MCRFVGVGVFVRLVQRRTHHERTSFNALHGETDTVHLQFEALQRIGHDRFMPPRQERQRQAQQADHYVPFPTHALFITNSVPKLPLQNYKK